MSTDIEAMSDHEALRIRREVVKERLLGVVDALDRRRHAAVRTGEHVKERVEQVVVVLGVLSVTAILALGFRVYRSWTTRRLRTATAWDRLLGAE